MFWRAAWRSGSSKSAQPKRRTLSIPELYFLGRGKGRELPWSHNFFELEQTTGVYSFHLQKSEAQSRGTLRAPSSYIKGPAALPPLLSTKILWGGKWMLICPSNRNYEFPNNTTPNSRCLRLRLLKHLVPLLAMPSLQAGYAPNLGVYLKSLRSESLESSIETLISFVAQTSPLS